MSYTVSDDKKRIRNRTDLTIRLTHLTNGDTDEMAFEVLISILNDKKLIGGTGYINCGKMNPAVCFQEVPIYAIAESLEFEKEIGTGRSRYRGFGIRTTKVHVYNKGGRPILYGNKDELIALLKDENEFWRIGSVAYEAKSNNDEIVSFLHEREWRVKGDFEFEYRDIEIILPDPKYYKKFVRYCHNNGMEDILESVNGIIVLTSVIGWFANYIIYMYRGNNYTISLV